MNDPLVTDTSSRARIQISMLSGAVVALMAASVYTLSQTSRLSKELERSRLEQDQMRRELTQTHNELLGEIARVHETSTVSTQSSQNSIDSLKTELQAARRQAQKLVGEAQVEATKHADDLAAKLRKMQEEQVQQAQSVTAVKEAVSQVETDADATKTRVGEVSAEVASVKNELATTKSDLDKTIADLKSTKGDLGIQSGLIATNAKDLEILKARGERNYTEFMLPREKAPRKVGDLRIRLKAADPKANRYTVDVIVDDKLVEKKDKTINEPVQFILSRTAQPCELVVNEIRKDIIIGYVAAPKTPQERN